MPREKHQPFSLSWKPGDSNFGVKNLLGGGGVENEHFTLDSFS